MTAQDAVIIFITSAITGFFANLIYYYVISKHESYIVEALISCSPLFTLVLAYLFLKEEINWVGIAGVLLITLGVICVSLNERAQLFEGYLVERS